MLQVYYPDSVPKERLMHTGSLDSTTCSSLRVYISASNIIYEGGILVLSVNIRIIFALSMNELKIIMKTVVRNTLGFERYRYCGIGYWPILASIGWYWYWPNTFLSNRAQYWANNSLRRRLATHDDLISRRPLHCRSWETLVKWYTNTRGLVPVKCAVKSDTNS